MRFLMSPYFRILISALTFGLLLAIPSYAGTVRFQDENLPHEYFENDGEIYVALDDLLVALGVSEIFNGTEVLIGNTLFGTIRIAPGTHNFTASDKDVDFGRPLINWDGILYVPATFLKVALRLETELKPEVSLLILYPEVFAITPFEGAIRITSSVTPQFDTFELAEPPRRVIDIKGAFLRGQNFSVTGSVLGLTAINAVRASQFTIDPPTVRIVLEWSANDPPGHTLYPDSRTISILVTDTAESSGNSYGSNILENLPVPDSPDENPVEPIEPTVDTVESTESEFTFESAVNNTVSNNPIPETPAPVAEIPVDANDPIMPEVPPTPEIPEPPENVDPAPEPDNFVPEKIDYPDEAVDWPLDKLGWNVDFDDGERDGEIVAKIDTPQFMAINDFTLAGEKGMRLVIDLQGSFLPGSERQVGGHGEIQAIRFGQFQPEITRIVFDISRVVGYDLDYDRVKGEITVKLLHGDLSGKTIVIDPGHGGEDPGAVVGGIEEKTLNLEMSYFLANFLKEHGAKVILTRESDFYVTLADRIDIAGRNGADLFIVVHNNATEEPTKMQGSLILYNNPEFMPLYRLTHRGIAARTGVPGIGPIEDERGLYLLRHSGDMPVLFVEAAFMTNSLDFARLTDSSRAYSRNIMMGVMDGVQAWYTHRDLPPVEYPLLEGQFDIGIFDLAGRPVVIDSTGENVDSGSVWDDEELVSEDEESSTEETAGEASDSESDDEDRVSENEKRRSRGRYRFD